ncbi:hypothetical protein SUGI_0700000 [Cryptomeria japonica]|uniref:putative UPF0481 protein At3g02645 n=1 Tax=Cryptomeria japonica TaxID=3369 RepID=UPI0024147660|nr:putative UPF0481 protein At3g02645 [Cryptomeria japonica]GLJ34780.1 hypothetical protein SUGI_0700000 [Cryptomeria japonica]
MAQDISSRCSFKGKEIQNPRRNGEGQTESNCSSESWLIDVKKAFIPPHKMWQVSTKVCIYRMPKCIMDWKVEAYAPSVISFGPYHHRKIPRLFLMDQYKLEAVHRVLARLDINVTELVGEIQKLESEIRECYGEPLEWDGETLSWMLTMDACFILEFFKSLAKPRCDSDINCFSLVFQNDDTCNSMLLDILDDILKMENQIPLYILITLLQLEYETREKTITELVERLIMSPLFDGSPFFSSFSNDQTKLKLKEHLQKNPPPFYLLDLSRMLIIDVLAHPSPESAPVVEYPDGNDDNNITNDRERCGWWRNVGLPDWRQRLSCVDILNNCFHATNSTLGQQLSDSTTYIPCFQLQGAGIKFQPGKIRFEKKRCRSSTLFLPGIIVDRCTETRLRNLMAYEECQRCSWSPQETVISQYVMMFWNLIDSEKDVSILKKLGRHLEHHRQRRRYGSYVQPYD